MQTPGVMGLPGEVGPEDHMLRVETEAVAGTLVVRRRRFDKEKAVQ